MKKFLVLVFFIINSHRISSSEVKSFTPSRARSLPDIMTNYDKEERRVGSCRIEQREHMYRLGLDCFRRGEEERGLDWFFKAAENDDPRAMNYIGRYYDRIGDADNARFWFSRGAYLGNTISIYNLAYMYDRDDQKGEAERLYKQIAKSYPNAKNNLAFLLYEQKDEDQALKLFEEAITAGSVEAIFNKAWIAEQHSNFAVAKAGYAKAADKGDPDAMFSLGEIYEKESDVINAKHWYKMAAEKGNEDAKAKVKAMGSGNILRRIQRRKVSLIKSP